MLLVGKGSIREGVLGWAREGNRIGRVQLAMPRLAQTNVTDLPFALALHKAGSTFKYKHIFFPFHPFAHPLFRALGSSAEPT